jgi:hypothetical protein
MKTIIIFLLLALSFAVAQAEPDSTKGKLVRTRETISDSGKVPMVIDGHGNYRWVASGGGGGTPAGSNYQVQYYNNGNFGADTNFTSNRNGAIFLGWGSNNSGQIYLYNGNNNFWTRIFSNADSGDVSFVLPNSNGSAGRTLITDGSGNTSWSTPSIGANSQVTPSNPSGTTSLTPVMAGLAGAITPTKSGSVLIIVSGIMRNTTAVDGETVQIAYGTGSAPANGDAATGTTAGNLLHMLNEPDFNFYPFSVQSAVTGLTVSTAYWIDLQFAAGTGGTANLQDISISVIEQ